jgi:hypothetical protein
MTDTNTPTEATKQLNAFLRGELSAVETYDQVLKKVPGDEIPELRQNRDCHFRRTQLLANAILAKGGKPETTSGAWGALAQAATGSATLFGRDAMISILEEGEDRGLADYRTAVGSGDEELRQLVAIDLLPAQKRTHGRMSQLEHQHQGASKGDQSNRSL